MGQISCRFGCARSFCHRILWILFNVTVILSEMRLAFVALDKCRPFECGDIPSCNCFFFSVLFLIWYVTSTPSLMTFDPVFLKRFGLKTEFLGYFAIFRRPHRHFSEKKLIELQPPIFVTLIRYTKSMIQIWLCNTASYAQFHHCHKIRVQPDMNLITISHQFKFNRSERPRVHDIESNRCIDVLILCIQIVSKNHCCINNKQPSPNKHETYLFCRFAPYVILRSARTRRTNEYSTHFASHNLLHFNRTNCIRKVMAREKKSACIMFSGLWVLGTRACASWPSVSSFGFVVIGILLKATRIAFELRTWQEPDFNSNRLELDAYATELNDAIKLATICSSSISFSMSQNGVYDRAPADFNWVKPELV